MIIKCINGHYEAYTDEGEFIQSADTTTELLEDLENDSI